jgi:uncharacterized protein
MTLNEAPEKLSVTPIRFSVLADKFAVCRLSPADSIPSWASELQGFSSITRTSEELSVVCREAQVPADLKSELGWVCFKLEGPFPFLQTGVLASILAPLAQASIPIFAISTFDTDYVLVKAEFEQRAISSLQQAGHMLVVRQSS